VWSGNETAVWSGNGTAVWSGNETAVWSGNQKLVTVNETFSHTMSYTLITAHLPESQVATQLLDAIKAKETADKIATILDSLTSLDPELGQNRDSKETEKTAPTHTVYPLPPPPKHTQI